MADLEDFVNHVRPYLQGCPTTTLKRVALEVLRDVCHRCPVWKEEEVIGTAAGLTECEIDPPIGAELVKVMKVTRFGTNSEVPMRPFSGEGEGSVQRCQQTKPNTLSIWPTPPKNMKTQLLTLELQCKPAMQGVVEIPDQTYADASELVSYGVQARVYKMPGKWSDPQAGEHFRQLYESELAYKKMMLREHSSATGMQLTGSPLA